jgi:hypothetical protein
MGAQSFSLLASISPCGDIDFVDETKIICDAPANPAGVYDVKAINTVQLVSLEGGFTYFAPIEVEYMEPNRGPTMGGMPAVVYGGGFSENSQVSVGGRVALAIEVIDQEEIRFLTPPGEAGSARVQVSNENGLFAIEDGFEYYDPVTIDSVLPGAGSSEGGEEIIITGQGIIEDTDYTVQFGLLEAEYEVIEDGELLVITPPGPTGSAVDVTLSTVRNGTYTASNAFYYYDEDELPTLALYNAMPNSGTANGGTLVVLSGAGFDAVDTVMFGDEEADIEDQEDNYMVVETDDSDPGVVDITVISDSDSATLEDGFTYLDAIDVDSIDPEDGDAAGGTEFIIYGEGFIAGSTVRFGALSASDVVILDETISGITPPGVVGKVDVEVMTPDGVSGVLEEGFTYTTDLEVHGFDPVSGAISGGTYIIVRGAGFVEPLTLTFDGVEAEDVEILDSASISARTPPHSEGYVTVQVTSGSALPVDGADRYLYYNPMSISGGSWGDEIDGALNVTVMSVYGELLPEAFVQLDVRSEAVYSGYTDVNGQLTLSGPDLSGEQTITATRLGFSSSTIQEVNAANVTIALECIPEDMCFSNDDCREGFVCTCGPPFGPYGICLVDVYCGIEIETQEQYDDMCVPTYGTTPYGLITGNLSGVHKVADPAPGERILGMVVTTDLSPFSPTPVAPGDGNTMEDDGPYTLQSRLGELALVAVCGVYNDLTEEFRAEYIGVRRGLFIVEGELYDIDIECDMKLEQSITIKSVNPPLTDGGPDNLRHQLYLHFGSEGYFGGFPLIQGTEEELTDCCFASLEEEFEGLDYYVLGSAMTGDTWPFSYVMMEGVSNVNEVVVLPEFLPVPELVVPEDGGVLVERYLEWELATDSEPDWYYLMIYDFYDIMYWDVFVPGNETIVNLPFFGDEESIGLFPSGALILQVLAVDSVSFDYDEFDFNDFYLDSWNGYSINVFVVNNP